MYTGFVVRIDNLQKHSNADRLQITKIFGDSIIVSLDVEIGDIGIYFPIGGQLSEEFCDANHLCRKKADGTEDSGYLDRDKRNIKAIRLRGEKSEGLYLPISCVEYLGVSFNEKDVGTTISTLNGVEICKKYIPKGSHRRRENGSFVRPLISKADIAPLFAEHADTEQLAYNLGAFREGDLIEITCKMHGTSQRTGYLPVLVSYRGHGLDNYFIHKYMKDPSKASKWLKKKMKRILEYAKPIYTWKYISGTRRTVLDDWDGGFYGSNAFRKQHADFFEGKLHKGETVYYEVVGFTDTGAPIMPSASNKDLGKDFIRIYGDTTTFSYGCSPEGEVYAKNADGVKLMKWGSGPQSDFYVYRMTMTNEDGDVVEYTPDYMRYRCEQMGVKTVPVFWKGYLETLKMINAYAQINVDNAMLEEIKKYLPGYELQQYKVDEISAGQLVKDLAELFYDGPDVVDPSHIREGVVVRIVNRPKFTAFKHKNFSFKVLSGIAVEKIAESGELDNLSDDVIAEM